MAGSISVLFVMVPIWLWAASVTPIQSICRDWTPHPSGDCGRYVRCFDDMTVFVKKCPANLHFNPNLHVCDWPWNVVCGNTSHWLPQEPPTTPRSHNTPSECIYSCPTGVEWGRFPDLDSNCQMFYECENGHCRIGQCPRGLQFNALILSCDLPENTLCPNFRVKDPCPKK